MKLLDCLELRRAKVLSDHPGALAIEVDSRYGMEFRNKEMDTAKMSESATFTMMNSLRKHDQRCFAVRSHKDGSGTEPLNVRGRDGEVIE